MDTNKAAYWIAIGVLALTLNSDYRHGKFVALHRAVGRADAVLCQLSTRAEQTLAAARGLTSREEFTADDEIAGLRGAEGARAQSELLRDQLRDEAEQIRDQVRDRVRDQVLAQSDMIRARAEMQRAQIEQIRSSTLSRFRLTSAGSRTSDRTDGGIHVRTAARGVTVVCPKTAKRMSVQAGLEPSDDSPDVDVDVADAF
jgi:hypothetical protein